MTITLRPAKPSDAVSISELSIRSKAFWGYSEEFMASCRDELMVSPTEIESAKTSYVLAECDNKLCGFYGVGLSRSLEFELDGLFVAPEYIGKGIGRLLMDHAKMSVIELGGEKLVIQSDPHAERFYLAAGGRLIGRRESGSIPGRFLPLFEILLKPTEVK